MYLRLTILLNLTRKLCNTSKRAPSFFHWSWCPESVPSPKALSVALTFRWTFIIKSSAWVTDVRVWVTERIGFVPSDALAGLAIESVTFAISSPAIEPSGRTDCTIERIGSGTNDLTVDGRNFTQSWGRKGRRSRGSSTYWYIDL